MGDIYSIVVNFLKEGGLFMYPISIVLVLGLAIAIERWVFLKREKGRNEKTFEDFLPLLRTNDHEKMTLFTRDHTAAISRIIGCGLDMMKITKQRADIEQAMNEGVMEVLPRLENRANYLAMLASVATLLDVLRLVARLPLEGGAERARRDIDSA